MAIRTILYGYDVENGKTVINIQESEIVKKVFSLYAEGKTLSDIALILTDHNVIYFRNEVKWNKNTISRMIENEKYIGNDVYPTIISHELFDKARTVKNQKSCKQKKHTKEIELLRKITVCGKCGGRYKRINTWGTREKWMCSNGCACVTYIDDPILKKAISDNFNTAINNPTVLDVKADSKYQPTIEAVKEENELLRLMDQPKISFSAVSKSILQGAKVRFNCCEFDDGELTEELKYEISQLSIDEKVDCKTMKKFIKQVTIQPDGGITTVFINNAEITNGGA